MEGHNKHFSHIHNLTIQQIPEGNEITCSGCNFAGTATVYACWQCNFFLHEHCFRATRSLQHPSHPSHPLTLLPFPTYPSNSFYCNSCNNVGTGFTYCCSDCEFDLHVQCAYGISLSSHLTPDAYAFPHQNPPLSIQAPTFNPQAAYMPHETPTGQHNSSPPNQQTLPSYNPQYTYIPHQEPTNQPIPSSPIVNYPPISAPQDSHLPRPIPSNHIQNYPPINETLPSLNASHAFHTPINPNVPIQISPPKAEYVPSLNATNGAYTTESPSRTDQGKTRGIMHFSHPHGLFLVNPIEDEDSTECSACEEVISGSRYSCSKSSCDFHLHMSCFQLAQKIKHKSHPEHPLILLANPYDNNEGQFGCSACNNNGAGFSYHCSTCQFDLHTQCASLPETMKRDDHDHPLKLVYSCRVKEQECTFTCDVCHRTIQEDFWTYCCEECDYDAHAGCVNCEETAVSESEDEEPKSSTGNPVLDAQLQMQRLQLQMQMSRQNAQLMMSMGQSLVNLTRYETCQVAEC